MNDTREDAQWKTFVDGGGFKLLALAGLSGHAMSVVCYLINCYVSGIKELLTSSRELSVLLGINAFEVEYCLETLTSMKIVRIERNNGDRMLLFLGMNPQLWQNLRLPEKRDSGMRRRMGDAANVLRMHPQKGVTLDSEPAGESSGGRKLTAASALEGEQVTIEETERWLEDERVKDSQVKDENATNAISALSFPLQEAPALNGFDGANLTAKEFAQEVLAHFVQLHPECDPVRETLFLDTLLSTHAREQVARMVHTFASELRSLGLLVGAWVHYSQKLETLISENQTPNLEDYRRQNELNDKFLRKGAERYVVKASQEDIYLTADERVLLNVFEEHDHPRRQLFWALKMRARYPGLERFFAEFASLAESPPPVPEKKG